MLQLLLLCVRARADGREKIKNIFVNCTHTMTTTSAYAKEIYWRKPILEPFFLICKSMGNVKTFPMYVPLILLWSVSFAYREISCCCRCSFCSVAFLYFFFFPISFFLSFRGSKEEKCSRCVAYYNNIGTCQPYPEVKCRV